MTEVPCRVCGSTDPRKHNHYNGRHQPDPPRWFEAAVKVVIYVVILPVFVFVVLLELGVIR